MCRFAKASQCKSYVGSNPTLSARIRSKYVYVIRTGFANEATIGK